MEENIWDLSHVVEDDGLLTEIQKGEAIGSIVDYTYSRKSFENFKNL